jgi:predicted DNA-binding protein (MmcQ/YjbR family)
MERAELEARLAGFSGAASSYPFGPEALVYKVRGKMFALLSGEGADATVTLKCTPEDGELLVSQFAAIKPGYHMNKRHWLTIGLSGDVPETLLHDLAGDSYALVVKGLPRAVQAELERS